MAGRSGSRRDDSGAYQRAKTASGSPRTSSLARYSLCWSSSVRAFDVQVCGCTRCAQADVAMASSGTATFRSRRIRDLLAGRRVVWDGEAGLLILHGACHLDGALNALAGPQRHHLTLLALRQGADEAHVTALQPEGPRHRALADGARQRSRRQRGHVVRQTPQPDRENLQPRLDVAHGALAARLD